MNKLKEIFTFIKNNLNGEYTKTLLVVVLTLLVYKIFGLFGIILAILFAILIDVCKTTNLKTIYEFVKEKFFLVFVFGLMFTACGTQKGIVDNYYSISQMIRVSKDTLTSQEYRTMVYNKKIPALTKFAKTYFKNIEENKINAYYVYYDSISNSLYNVKELINNRDTTYVVEKKNMKK